MLQPEVSIQGPSQRDTLVIDLNLFSSVPRPHFYVSRTDQPVTARNCCPAGWERKRPLFTSPLVPRELLWTKSAKTYCLSPRVAGYRGERINLDSNEKTHSNHRVVFSFYQTSPPICFSRQHMSLVDCGGGGPRGKGCSCSVVCAAVMIVMCARPLYVVLHSARASHSHHQMARQHARMRSA